MLSRIGSKLLRFSPCVLGGLGIAPIGDHDQMSDTKTAIEMRRIKMETEKPMDRLYLMFSMDEYGIISPELNSVYQASFMGMFTGIVYGGFIHSKSAYEDFLSNNQASSFTSHLEAKKKLQDKVTMGFGKGAFMWGWRLGLFCGTYVLITTAISVYRDKSSIWEYLAAGLTTGTLYKFKQGPKAMMVGGGLGLVLGGLAGVMSLALLYISGTTVQEMRYWQYQIQESRNKALIAAKSGEVTPDALLEDYKSALERKNEKLEAS